MVSELEPTYRGWTVEKRLCAIHWLVAAVWVTQIVGTLAIILVLADV